MSDSVELKFPVVAHHRVIVNAAAKDVAKMQELFADVELVEPLAADAADPAAASSHRLFALIAEHVVHRFTSEYVVVCVSVGEHPSSVRTRYYTFRHRPVCCNSNGIAKYRWYRI